MRVCVCVCVRACVRVTPFSISIPRLARRCSSHTFVCMCVVRESVSVCLYVSVYVHLFLCMCMRYVGVCFHHFENLCACVCALARVCGQVYYIW